MRLQSGQFHFNDIPSDKTKHAGYCLIVQQGDETYAEPLSQHFQHCCLYNYWGCDWIKLFFCKRQQQSGELDRLAEAHRLGIDDESTSELLRGNMIRVKNCNLSLQNFWKITEVVYFLLHQRPFANRFPLLSTLQIFRCALPRSFSPTSSIITKNRSDWLWVRK